MGTIGTAAALAGQKETTLAVVDGKLTFSIPLSECKACKKPMLNWWRSVDTDDIHAAHNIGVMRESYRESGVCLDCMNKGGFLRNCDCCGEAREFPKQFEFEIYHQPEYAECDPEWEYVCTDCTNKKQDHVIDILASADEIKRLNKKSS